MTKVLTQSGTVFGGGTLAGVNNLSDQDAILDLRDGSESGEVKCRVNVPAHSYLPLPGVTFDNGCYASFPNCADFAFSYA